MTNGWRWMRWGAGLALAAMAAQATAAEFVRGDLKFETGDAPAFVTRRDWPTQWDPKSPGADDHRWRYWWQDIQSDRRGGRNIVYVDRAYQPRAQSLVGDAGRVQIEFVPDFQTLTIHRIELLRDGRWQNRLVPERISLARRESDFEQDMTDGSATALLVLDDVRVDDVIRVSYSIAGSNPILAGQTADWSTLGWTSPMMRSNLRVLYDPGTEFRVYRENTALEPQVRRSADGVEVQVLARDLTPTVFEDSYPVWYQPYPTVEIAAARTWADVVAWALPLYPKHDAPFDDELERRIAQWKALPDPVARMTAALRTVQNDVRYFGIEIGDNSHRPNSPDLVWRRRYGDCKDKVYLLSTLLHRLGIDAVPALVNTERGKATGGFVPSASSFDHVIVRARIGDQTIWLDPTIDQQGGDPRRVDLADYGMVLPVAPGVSALETIAPPREANAGVDLSERFVPDADGKSMTFEVDTIYTGTSADFQRRNTLSERGDELARRYSEYYRKRYGDVDAIGTPTVTDDPVANRLVVHERYRLNSPLQTESSGVRGLDLFAEALDTPSALPASLDRKGPLAFTERGRYRHVVTVQLPPLWTPTFSDENSDSRSDAFAFHRNVSIKDRTVTLEYQLDVGRDEVPADRVAEHLQALRKVRDDLSATLRFTIPASLNAQQRQERLRALLRALVEEGDK